MKMNGHAYLSHQASPTNSTVEPQVTNARIPQAMSPQQYLTTQSVNQDYVHVK